MREIKFRAWDKESLTMLMPREFELRQEIDNGFHAFRFHEDGEFVALKLMQFTGLKDKNGKEIYEGDIILTDQIVTWNDSNEYRGDNILNCWGIQNGKYELSNYDKHNDYEVIGNIYENKELLQ